MTKQTGMDFGLWFVRRFIYKYGLNGTPLTQEEVATYAKWAASEAGLDTRGCTPQRIQQIEGKAIRRLRNRHRFMKDPVLKELVETLFQR